MHAMPILRPYRMHLIPAIGALLSGWLSFTPSLLPRDAVYQGLLAAVAALLGYGLFGAIGWMLHASGVRLTTVRRTRFRVLLGLAAALGTAVMLWLAHGWQQEQRSLIGMPAASGADPVRALLVALVCFALLLAIARAVRAFANRVGRLIARVLPARVAAVLGAVLVLWASAVFVNDVAVGRVAERLDSSFLLINDEFVTDTTPPALSEVSAGPGSAVAWEDLGRQGRVFISNTPTSADIESFLESIGEETDGARAARQPIRVYIGTGSGELSLAAQVETAVDELKRTGGFDREVLNVATGTGRGWVNENQARALEYLWRGDTATVSVQYSHLPSWMSYLVDAQRAREAGQALFEGVYAYWATLPEGERPRLVVSGESLGSYGSEGAFSGASDLSARTDGALWVGPTANNLLWQTFTRHRQPGSPVSLPIYEAGETVRFSANGVDWAGDGAWQAPRVAYLQHANDPVTWLDFGSVLVRPDFLAEDLGPGVPPQMIWIPVITTLQLALDQLALGVPDGQGHEFGQAPVAAWAEVLPPEDWSGSATSSLADWLAELRASDLDTRSSS